VEDAVQNHYRVFVLKDAVKAIGGDSGLDPSLDEMKRLGAIAIDFDSLDA
jgi:hypothetical protein